MQCINGFYFVIQKKGSCRVCDWFWCGKAMFVSHESSVWGWDCPLNKPRSVPHKTKSDSFSAAQCGGAKRPPWLTPSPHNAKCGNPFNKATQIVSAAGNIKKRSERERALSRPPLREGGGKIKIFLSDM
jgi:hypothetical protein